MNSPSFSGPDPVRSRLRTIMAALEREIAQLPGNPPSGLASAFAQLVALLALGPEPEVRACPACRHIGMRAATLCGNCWTKLIPPTEHDGVEG